MSSSLLSVQEENRLLQQELSRVEDLLAQSRAERDELAIKYNALSERVGGPTGGGRGRQTADPPPEETLLLEGGEGVSLATPAPHPDKRLAWSMPSRRVPCIE